MKLFKRGQGPAERVLAKHDAIEADIRRRDGVRAPALRYELTHAPGGTTDHLITPGATATVCSRERGADWHPGGGRRQCGLCSEIAARDDEGLVAS